MTSVNHAHLYVVTHATVSCGVRLFVSGSASDFVLF